MFTALLLCDPARPALDPALVEALRNAWGGGAAVWLAPDEAVEFALPVVPENRWDVWRDCQAQGVDLVILPAVGRRKKMLLADMDSTMIEQECIDELAEEAGVGAQVKQITARAMNGELDFEAALSERVGLLKGLPEAVIAKVLDTRISLMPGGPVLLATMKREGAYAALVSGGFTAFTGKVAGMLGFDEHRANELLVENGALTGVPGQPILGQQAKVDALEDITAARGIGREDVLAVGDGANDLGMLHRAGLGVALHAKPSVASQCDVRVNFGDLTALLYLQGYAKADFAEV
ncbi:MAG: phosphoserine phosphatase SerB [Sulfitobacter sp.]